MTNDEFQYLTDLERLDRIQLGMVWPSIKVKKPDRTRDKLLARGWVWASGKSVIGYPIIFLGTRGLRALNRANQKKEIDK